MSRDAAAAIAARLAGEYGVHVEGMFAPLGEPEPQGGAEGPWSLTALRALERGVVDLAAAMGGPEAFRRNLGKVRVSRVDTGHLGLAVGQRIKFAVAGAFTEWTAVHELAHVWDGRSRKRLSKRLQREVGAGFRHPILHRRYPDRPDYWYDPGQGPPPCGVDRHFNRAEDFAESVAAYVYPDCARRAADSRGWPYHDPARGYSYAHFHETPRGQYVRRLIEGRMA